MIFIDVPFHEFRRRRVNLPPDRLPSAITVRSNAGEPVCVWIGIKGIGRPAIITKGCRNCYSLRADADRRVNPFSLAVKVITRDVRLSIGIPRELHLIILYSRRQPCRCRRRLIVHDDDHLRGLAYIALTVSCPGGDFILAEIQSEFCQGEFTWG